MTQHRSPRKSRQQWQALVERCQRSGQSPQVFCEVEGLPFATFCKWQRRLTGVSQAEAEAPSFLDLAGLMPERAAGRWHIVLSLGNGVELRLSQA